MGSFRVYNIAKELNISSADLLAKCKELGIEVKSHSSSITEELAEKIRAAFKKPKPADEQLLKPKPEKSLKDHRERESSKDKQGWDEEKKLNIRKVLDKELDKEEKEGSLRRRIKQYTKKEEEIQAAAAAGKSMAVAEKETLEGLEEKILKRPEIKKIIELPEGITIKRLSERINIPSSEILQKVFNLGSMLTINQPLDNDIIELLSHEYNFKYSVIGFEDKLDEFARDTEDKLITRPPIVTVMGHVDHGKTTLLDAVRKSKVVLSEAGGITQSIGAYQTEFNGRKITFIDTPGHEAFTTMRARGAKVTDIAVIVIAADDGIMPQTIEAINHAKEAGVPIIVAINKIDLPNSNPDKIKQSLTEYDLVPEEWGGDTIFVNISAKTGDNIDNLLEMLLLVADLNDIKGNPDAEGLGIIIESKLDKGFGPVGTVLVKRGNIKVGDFFVTGNSYGRVRTIRNEHDVSINKAVLSQPVIISGFTSVPQAGDKFFIVKNEKVAKDIISKRESQKKLIKLSEVRKHITLEDLADISKENEIKKLKIILKAESNGSLDAVEKSLKDVEKENIKIDVIHRGVGAISDSDILLASASDAIVIGFGVVASSKAKVMSKEENIEIRTYNIIYKLIEDIQLASKGLLEPKYEEKIKGNVEIREIFRISKVGNIAGCYILDGEVERGDTVRIIRDGRIIYTGKIDSLHRFKEDAKKVAAGYECGIRVENFQDLNKGDTLEVYEQVEVKQ
ncbi:MAG: Translation initiation factor IF-2 [Actinobacteria bacterium ADurb.Bin346]|nr:MAG: Translation initiation factor IF-2 [Actinobacteria bacterium ADurb.Bin346]